MQCAVRHDIPAQSDPMLQIGRSFDAEREAVRDVLAKMELVVGQQDARRTRLVIVDDNGSSMRRDADGKIGRSLQSERNGLDTFDNCVINWHDDDSRGPFAGRDSDYTG